MSKKINTETTFIAFHISKSDAMNAKITSNINLAKKLKKLGSRQETVLVGVADHLTEDEKSNINHVLSKMEQLSINIKVEEELPSQHTSEKTNFETFFISFKHELRAYEESDKMDCLMFSTVDYFRFKVDLYHSFNPKYYQRYIADLTIFENQANRVLLFLASDRGFIYSKMREDCLKKNITWKEYIIGQKLSYTTVNNHIQFHELVVEYPIVLISGASKTEWFKFMKQFKGAIQNDDSLKTRLTTSLKEFVAEDSLFEDVDESLNI